MMMGAAALVAAGCGGLQNERQEQEAMDFLYRYMSVADIGDYDSTFFLENVRTSLRARQEMPWGNQVPDDLFRHFVLPVRVSNERLDDFRTVYYDTLKARVEGMSMHDAALEINHWCHEKVTYIPSDSRTFSPRALMLNAEGRCGEESTFTVAAMRAVGIPAREVYTPRWAHTDDNHAWVEVWTDGKWSFLGACEPEAELNMAWFNEPAARAMLMYTTASGDYRSAEDVIRRTHSFTKINVIGNYVKTRNNIVTVRDMDGQLVEGAAVSFCIYNYGELYPAVTKLTDSDGTATLHTGLGDMAVWVQKDGKYGIGLLTYGDSPVPAGNAGETGPDCELTVSLQYDDESIFAQNFDIVPPAPGRIPAEASEEAIAANKVRLSQEDSIRHAYTATFPDMEKARAEVKAILDGGSDGGCDSDLSKVGHEAARQIVDAKGNWRQVRDFLSSAMKSGRFGEAVSLLKSLSRKDLKDTEYEVLMDALETVPPLADGCMAADSDTFINYVACPRIAGEYLQPYRKEIRDALKDAVPEAACGACGAAGMPYARERAARIADAVISWTRDNIERADSLNPRWLQATPAGVLKVRKADRRSRQIFVVAALRSFGIPARKDVLTGKPQYMLDAGQGWIDITLDGTGADDAEVSGKVAVKGALAMNYEPGKGMLDNPEYYRHFTLSKIESGIVRQLEFDGGDATELGADVTAESFRKPFPLEVGTYMLTTGTRMASGKVLARIVTFRVDEGKTSSVQLIMRENDDEIGVIGAMDPEAKYLALPQLSGEPSDKEAALSGDFRELVEKSILSTTGRGYFLVAVMGSGDEPTNHALRDLSALSGTKWDRPVILLSENEAASVKLQSDLQEFGSLSDLSGRGLLHYGIDSGRDVRKMLCDGCHSKSMTLPVIAVCDSFGRIVYLSTGYNTSLASQLQTVIHGI